MVQSILQAAPVLQVPSAIGEAEEADSLLQPRDGVVIVTHVIGHLPGNTSPAPATWASLACIPAHPIPLQFPPLLHHCMYCHLHPHPVPSLPLLSRLHLRFHLTPCKESPCGSTIPGWRSFVELSRTFPTWKQSSAEREARRPGL